MENQAKIKFGGIKLLSGGSCLVNSSPWGEFRLSSQVTSPLAENKLNLTFLTHVAGDRTTLCINDAVGEGPLTLLRNLAGSDDAFQYQKDIALLAVYPHDKLARNVGAIIQTLAGSNSKIFGLASSLSALTTIVESRRQEKVVQCLFEDFQFTSFATAGDFFSAQEFPEEYVRKAVATYQEKVIKVYWVLPYPDLDLWAASIPSATILGNIADVLIKLGELGLTLPFLIAMPRLQTDELLIAFSTARSQGAKDQGSDVRRLLSEHIPGVRPMRLTPVAGIFLHGPHFGDRYGIANTLVEALERVHVTILALSCTISSISVIIRQQELTQALLVLSERFDGPVSEPLYGS
jgi:aspartokinase